MGKGILITAMVLMVGIVFVGGVWGQKNPRLGSLRGTITRVDLANKEIVVKNHKTETTFQWEKETSVNGPGKEKWHFENLRKGMTVTLLYREENRNKVANRIDVKAANPEISTGWELPFECGVRVC